MYKTYHSVQDIDKILEKSKNIFFIGIGGVSMSSLAHISAEKGLNVKGSDRTMSPITQKLEEQNIEIFYEHKAENVKGCDAVVYTAAISEDNPELVYAKEHGIELIYRADYLGYIMSKYEYRVGVSGMHGKSTATSMTSHIFLNAKVNPTVILGAVMKELEGGTYRRGSEKYFIMEACEYCDSFLSFTPNIAVVLNIEMDHPDYFKDLEHIKDSFRKYISIADNGFAVVNWDDCNVRDISANYKGKLIKFGINSEDLDYKAVNISYENGKPCFDIIKGEKTLARINLSVTGEHNIMNALASTAVADICNIEAEDIKRGLESYSGADRRMEYKGKICGGKADLYEDYAHHPTEIKATLKGAKMLAKNDVWCVFQPHTYTRTAELFEDFAKSFSGVKPIFADIYAAREINTTGISSKHLADRIDGALYLDSFEKIADYLKENVAHDDMVIIMGAGDVNQICTLFGESENDKKVNA